MEIVGSPLRSPSTPLGPPKLKASIAISDETQQLHEQQTWNNRSPTLSDLLSLYPVYDRLCVHLPLRSTLALSATCKQLRTESQIRWGLRVDRQLERFVQKPLALRSQLGKYGSLISGSFVVQFFAQEQWLESDLDIFVEKGDAIQSFDTYLQQNEHYRLVSAEDARFYAIRTLLEIRTYRRPQSLDPAQAKVQLIVTQEMPILGILQGFYMTAVLNVVSWNKAYALCARDTFLDRKSYRLKELDPCVETALQKYDQRGWALGGVGRLEEHSPTSSIQSMRRLGDRFTWTVLLPTENVEKPKQPDFVLEYSSFFLAPNPVTLGGPNLESEHYSLMAHRFRHVALDYRFVYPCGTTWGVFLGERLHHHAWLGIQAMKPEERPQWFCECETFDTTCIHFWAEPHFEEFQRPEHWITFDQEIPNWYDEWFKITLETSL